MPDDTFNALAWIRFVWSANGALDTQERAVMTALVRHADTEGKCFPGLTLIGNETKVSRRKVMYSLDRIESLGLLRREKRKLGQGFASSLYHLPLTPPGSASCALGSDPREGLPSASCAPGVVHEVHRGSAPGAPEVTQDLSNRTTHIAPKSRSSKLKDQEIPEDWKPNENHRSFAAKHGLELELEAIGFRGHYEGQKLMSPNGRFTTWLANQAKWNLSKGGPRKVAPQRGMAAGVKIAVGFDGETVEAAQ